MDFSFGELERLLDAAENDPPSNVIFGLATANVPCLQKASRGTNSGFVKKRKK